MDKINAFRKQIVAMLMILFFIYVPIINWFVIFNHFHWASFTIASLFSGGSIYIGLRLLRIYTELKEMEK